MPWHLSLFPSMVETHWPSWNPQLLELVGMEPASKGEIEMGVSSLHRLQVIYPGEASRCWTGSPEIHAAGP